MKEDITKEIADLKLGGQNSAQVAKILGLDLGQVNAVFAKLNTAELEKEDVRGRSVSQKVATTKMQIGHFAKINDQIKEEHESLKSTQTFLVLNIKHLRAIVAMLEQKEKMLKSTIAQMEDYIRKGSVVADIFIENEIEI